MLALARYESKLILEKTVAWFLNLNLFKKISIILVIAIISFVTIISTTISGQKSTQNNLQSLENEIAPLLLKAKESTVLLERADETYGQSVSFGDEDLKTQGDEKFAQLINTLAEMKALDTKNKSQITSLESVLASYQKITIEVVSMMLSNSDDLDFERVGQLSEQKAEKLESSKRLLKNYTMEVEKSFENSMKQIVAQGEENLITTTAIGLSAGIIMAFITIVIGRIISHSVNDLADSLSELAKGEGDLKHSLSVKGNDELGNVATNFNSFLTVLRSAILNIINVAQPLSLRSSEIQSCASNVKVSVTTQTEQTTLVKQAMQELQTSVKEISNSATQAASMVKIVEEESNKGLNVVNQSIAVSQELNTDMQQVSEAVLGLSNDTQNVHGILDVINSIAEQTNLLALNAAIEAARAGEQGRGFAVVADEVRALASKTSEATTEIRQVLDELKVSASQSANLMESASEKTRINQERAESAGQALNQISTQIDELSMVNNQIATATEQQSNVTTDVVENIARLHASFETTVTMFTEVESISNQLHEFSDQLTDATSKFKV